jgi:hypothetical protein
MTVGVCSQAVLETELPYRLEKHERVTAQGALEHLAIVSRREATKRCSHREREDLIQASGEV